MTDPMRSLKAQANRARSQQITDMLVVQLTEAGLPEPRRELRFAAPRRWRFDLAYPLHWLAIEIEGGVHSVGRHTRGAGYVRDLVKYNTATLLGWRVLRVTPDMIESSHEARDLILEAFGHERL